MKEEILEQIAERVPPGDNWRLFIDKTTVVEGLVQALTTYLRKTGFNGEYRLDPLGGKLYAIRLEDAPEPEWDLYGEYPVLRSN